MVIKCQITQILLTKRWKKSIFFPATWHFCYSFPNCWQNKNGRADSERLALDKLISNVGRIIQESFPEQWKSFFFIYSFPWMAHILLLNALLTRVLLLLKLSYYSDDGHWQNNVICIWAHLQSTYCQYSFSMTRYLHTLCSLQTVCLCSLYYDYETHCTVRIGSSKFKIANKQKIDSCSENVDLFWFFWSDAVDFSCSLVVFLVIVTEEELEMLLPFVKGNRKYFHVLELDRF